MYRKTIKDVVTDSPAGTGILTDVTESETIEVCKDHTGKLWVNVDGVCVFRSGQHLLKIIVETPKGRKEFT